MTKANNRDSIRSQLFSKSRFKTKIVDMLGQRVEIRQPSIGDLNRMSKTINKESNDKDAKSAVVQLIIDYSYVPGTKTKLFTNADKEALSALPGGQWLVDYQAEFMKLSGIDMDAALKNLNQTA